MARHSHWAQIKLKKGAEDKKRGKIFTKHARFIEVAARSGGGDLNTNSSLRLAIENARLDNLPKENIERAIKKGIGELQEGEQMQEVTYEGFGPGGIALLIDTLTDNKNRTNQTMRNILYEFGGHLGNAGSTSFLFETRGEIHVKARGERDADELLMIDAGAEDIEQETVNREQKTEFVIYTAAGELGKVKKNLEGKGFTVESAQLTKIPKNLVEISDDATAKKILGLMEALEEEDDVLNVAANFDISASVSERLAARENM